MSLTGLTITAHYQAQAREYASEPAPAPGPLDPGDTWGFFLHDFQIGDYWSEDGVNRDGYNRVYPTKSGRPETVRTKEKEDRVSLSPAWQEFHKRLFVLAAYGVNDLAMFPMLQQAFDSTMAPNRVITNNKGYPEGYMPLAMGGNIGRIIGEASVPAFGPAWQIETLDGSQSPPDVEDVFFNKPWLWSKATITRYAFPDDDIQGLGNPWQHVIPFPQLDAFGAHLPLLLISNKGVVHVQKQRVGMITDGKIPNPYNPPLDFSRP